MPRVPATLEGPEYPKLRKIYEQISRLLNGTIGFGNGTTGRDNIDGNWVSVTFALANTDTLVVHNLGRLPAGYIVMQKSAACDVYNGTVGPTSTNITLKGTTASTVVLFIC